MPNNDDIYGVLGGRPLSPREIAHQQLANGILGMAIGALAIDLGESDDEIMGKCKHVLALLRSATPKMKADLADAIEQLKGS